MTALPKITDSLHAKLETAKDERQLQRAKLEQAQQELTRAQGVAENHTQRLQQAITDEHAAVIEDVAKVATKRRDAEAMADAANRRVTDAQAKVASCQSTLKAAERDVEQSVDAILLHEAEMVAAELTELDRQARTKREQLIALRLANPAVANSRVATEAVDPPGFFDIPQYSNQLQLAGPHLARLDELREAHCFRRSQLIA